MARKKWESWGEVYYHYLRKGWDNGAAALAADQWEKRQVKTAQLEHISSPDCWCEPEQDHIESDLYIHRERH